MAIPKVDEKLLNELDDMGFPLARATRALHFSGNTSLEAAINWIIDHENDPDIDEMPLVPVDIAIESPEPSLNEEERKLIAEELRGRARKKKEEEEKNLEREREKARIQAGKELLEAKRIQEENEIERNIAFRKAEKEEEKRARDKFRQKLEEDKLQRRWKLGVPPKNPAAVTNSIPVMQNTLPLKSAVKPQHLRECLRTLKLSYKDDDARVKRAFQTLMVYVRNVAKNPDDEKFRKIRCSNPLFQDRVGSLKGGIEFLELCGFEMIEGGNYLYLPRDKVDMRILNSAGSELIYAMTNPFFGILSKV